MRYTEGKQFTTEIIVPDADDFVRTKISPMQMAIQDGRPVFIPCDPDDAAFWSVFLVSDSGTETLIADCISQGAAQDMETLLYCIAANFKPEIWQKKK